MQGHYVDPTAAWLKTAPASSFSFAEKGGCALDDGKSPRSHLACLTSEEFVKDVFLDSDTDMMVLSFVPARRDASPLEIESADAVRQIVDRMEGNHRLLIHGRVNPNQPGDVEDMEMLRDRWKVAAWKTYTQWGPEGTGFYLDDEVGIRFVEEARRLGVRIICVHKGLPFGKKSYEHSQCRDIGPVAKRFPDVSFLVYHSGFVTDVEEKAYGRKRRRRRHRHAHPLAAGERNRTGLERLRRTRQHLAFPDARSRAGRARSRQAPEVLRSRQRALGHGLHLVRIAAGPDPGVPRLPDLAASSASAMAIPKSRRRCARRSSA